MGLLLYSFQLAFTNKIDYHLHVIKTQSKS